MSKEHGQLDRCFVRSESFVHRQVGSESVLVPIHTCAAGPGRIFTLNDTAERVWQLIDGRSSVRDILDTIVNEFDIDRDTAEPDTLELLAHFERIGAVAEDSGE